LTPAGKSQASVRTLNILKIILQLNSKKKIEATKNLYKELKLFLKMSLSFCLEFSSVRV
jgi:hypothetical protein